MNKFIPYGRQDINKSDIESVLSVLKSDFLTQGPKVVEFENKVAQLVGSKNAIATNSATSALHIACLALDLRSNDLLWTSPNSFVASANCGLYCGASVDFVDIDKKTLNICPIALENKLHHAYKINKLPKVIVVVHFAGNSADMKKIHKVASAYDIKLIEDASHAIGGKYNNKLIGSCEFSDITIFSFHPVKIITTGEGGIALTNNKALHNKMSFYRSHGITRDKNNLNYRNKAAWYYEQQELGFNYRLNDIQAALGISQLKRLETYVLKRNKLALYYKKKMSKLPILFQEVHGLSAYHLFVIQLSKVNIAVKRDEIFKVLKQKNIGVNLHYYPIHLQPYYRALGFREGDFPNAESYAKKAITLPLYPKLKIQEIDYVIKVLKEIIN